MDINTYNKYTAIRYIPDAIINRLFENEVIWKLLKYTEADALLKENLTFEEKQNLIYKGYVWENGRWILDDSTKRSIFRQPFIDDANDNAQTMIRIYLSNILPQNRVASTVYYTIELITHMKCIQILSDLGEEEGQISVSDENRLEVLLQQVLETLNGAEVGSIGKLFFDMDGGYKTKAEFGLYNNRNYCGIRLVVGCQISN